MSDTMYGGMLPPSSPVVGDLWYDTVTCNLSVWTGTSWRDASAGKADHGSSLLYEDEMEGLANG